MIAIVDYNAGNTESVANALTRLEVEYRITDDPDAVARADKIIFPGVGAAGAAMQALKKRGLDQVLKKARQPVLGICLGLQLLADFSDEDNTKCLGIIPGRVTKFSDDLKVPQMGWNKVNRLAGRDPSHSAAPQGKLARDDNGLLAGILDHAYFYFVHSYYLPVGPYTVGTALYGVPFSAIVRKDNFYATQFHPEKSGDVGLKVLRNFCQS